MDKKPDLKMSDEELVKLATQGKLADADDCLNEAQRFAIAFELAPGHCKVTASYIFTIYRQWSKKPMKKIGFFMQFAKMFHYKIEQKSTQRTLSVYYTNKNYLDFARKLQALKDIAT